MQRRNRGNEVIGNRTMIALLCLLAVSDGAIADDAGLLRCRAITDAAARLACYDALPVPSSASQPAPPAASNAAPSAESKSSAAAAAAMTQRAVQEFGLEERQPIPTLTDQIDSRVQGKFEGWWPNARIRLVNGQVWQVDDGSSRFYDLDSPKVTITRGALGAFYLNLDGDNRTVRVRRVQ
jgi:hypothetical protein